MASPLEPKTNEHAIGRLRSCGLHKYVYSICLDSVLADVLDEITGNFVGSSDGHRAAFNLVGGQRPSCFTLGKPRQFQGQRQEPQELGHAGVLGFVTGLLIHGSTLVQGEKIEVEWEYRNKILTNAAMAHGKAWGSA